MRDVLNDAENGPLLAAIRVRNAASSADDIFLHGFSEVLGGWWTIHFLQSDPFW